MAQSAGRVGDIERAREHFADAVAAARAQQSTLRLTEQYWQVGFFEISVGAPDRALLAFQEAAGRRGQGASRNTCSVPGHTWRSRRAELGDSDAAEWLRASATRAFENPNLGVFGQVRISYLVLRAALDSVAGRHGRSGALSLPMGVGAVAILVGLVVLSVELWHRGARVLPALAITGLTVFTIGWVIEARAHLRRTPLLGQ